MKRLLTLSTVLAGTAALAATAAPRVAHIDGHAAAAQTEIVHPASATAPVLLTVPVVAQADGRDDDADRAERDSGGPLTISSPFYAEDGTPLPVAETTEAVETAVAYDPREEMTLAFIFHIDEGLAEQDVFYEREPGSGEVYRPTVATRDMDAALYAPAEAVPHTPLQTENIGPWPRGKALGVTLGDWFAAKGEATYVCENGEGTLDASFRNLVPNGLYTMWHDFAVWPPTEPFIGFYDLPFGARDGSENAFTADADGNAEFVRTIKPCLQLSGEQLISELAIAWHSDGHTYGYTPGEFSTDTHVQMYVTLPARTGL